MKKEETIIEEVRILKRGRGASAIFATLATIVANVAIVFAVRADNQIKIVQGQVKSMQTQISTLQTQSIKTANALNLAAASAGTSTNDYNAAVPNGGG
jgi:hypothetical protein